ncbi:hypothetical protein BU26DRAFT_75417 [Trematosphaeria pertusa]|uniref:F-box domain-containing protein n=1 Tax=Trematosphaeria pertusa TaxID=390896 RepID=A0A6A6I8B1_9PLEO|nr:uncharacterized protein BU26DRAFT_75417 [Trematosphaeria pertusa]KAF2245773.1 hypothetical protein BU26DRAFT_75417 [Trematosphaeria pertusa]
MPHYCRFGMGRLPISLLTTPHATPFCRPFPCRSPRLSKAGMPPRLSFAAGRAALRKLLRNTPAPVEPRPDSPSIPDPFKESWKEVMQSLEDVDGEDGSPSSDLNLVKNGPSLGELPEEILLEVISCLEAATAMGWLPSTESLHALSLASRQFYRLATPSLYRRYCSQRDRSSTKQYHYVRTLMSCPDLAKHVQSLQWSIPLLDADPHPHPNEITSRLEEYGSWFTVEAALAIRGKRGRRPGEGEDAYFTAAMMHTPNITHLHFLDSRSSRSLRGHRLFLQPLILRCPHSFQHLKSVHIWSAVVRLEDIPHLLQLSSLRTLTLKGFIDERKTEWLCTPGISNVDDLSLELSFLDALNIADIITSCKALRKFSYSHDPLNMDQVDQTLLPRLDFQTIKAALDGHRKSLQEIRIQVLLYNDRFPHWTTYGQVDSFATYEKLSSLHLPAYAIIPRVPTLFVEQLPPNLHTLELTDCSFLQFGNRGMKALESLLRYSRDGLMSWRMAYLARELAAFLTYDDWKEFQKRFEVEGILLRIREYRIGLVEIPWVHGSSLQTNPAIRS